jgi:hypothetical protein
MTTAGTLPLGLRPGLPLGLGAAVPLPPDPGGADRPLPRSLLSMTGPPDLMLGSDQTLAVSLSDLKHLFDVSRKCRTLPVKQIVRSPVRSNAIPSNGCTIELSFA